MNFEGKSYLHRIVYIGLLCAYLGTSAGSPQAAEAKTADNHSLTVQTFNAYGPIYAFDLQERTEGFINEYYKNPATFLFLQEVWDPKHSNKLATSLLGFSKTASWSDFDQNQDTISGLRILANGQVIKTSRFDYPLNNDGLLDTVRDWLGVIKAAGAKEIELEPFGRILLVNTHTHPLSETIREVQMNDLIAWLLPQLARADHLIIAGDFNFVPDSPAYQRLVNGLGVVDAYADFLSRHGRHEDLMNACTYCSHNPYSWGGGDRRIDYIFIKSLPNGGTSRGQFVVDYAEINLPDPGRKDGVLLSDHYGVRARLKLETLKK